MMHFHSPWIKVTLDGVVTTPYILSKPWPMRPYVQKKRSKFDRIEKVEAFTGNLEKERAAKSSVSVVSFFIRAETERLWNGMRQSFPLLIDRIVFRNKKITASFF